MYPKTSSLNFLIIQQIRGYPRPLTMPFISQITPKLKNGIIVLWLSGSSGRSSGSYNFLANLIIHFLCSFT